MFLTDLTKQQEQQQEQQKEQQKEQQQEQQKEESLEIDVIELVTKILSTNTNYHELIERNHARRTKYLHDLFNS